ncbi:co-chaperone YbbN [Corynebacterium camporealensis]
MTNPNAGFTGGAFDLSQLKETSQQEVADSASFFTVTEENFEQDLVRRSAEVPVVALIGSSRSSASEELRKDFADLAKQGGGKFVVGYVNADKTPQIAQVFGVKNLPTTVALAAGQPVTNFEGAQPREALQQWTDMLAQKLGPQLSGASEQPQEEEEEPTDPRLLAAEEALNRGDFDAATATYDEILASEPDNAEIKQARDTVQLLRRLQGTGTDPLGAADAAPDDVNAQLVAADSEVVAGTPEKAFDRLLDFIQTHAGDDKQAAKDRLLELFKLYDAADPRVLDARTRLASALY